MNEQFTDVRQFLDMIHQIESKVIHLIQTTNLSEEEKKFILDHILIVPGHYPEKYNDGA